MGTGKASRRPPKLPEEPVTGRSVRPPGGVRHTHTDSYGLGLTPSSDPRLSPSTKEPPLPNPDAPRRDLDREPASPSPLAANGNPVEGADYRSLPPGNDPLTASGIDGDRADGTAPTLSHALLAAMQAMPTPPPHPEVRTEDLYVMFVAAGEEMLLEAVAQGQALGSMLDMSDADVRQDFINWMARLIFGTDGMYRFQGGCFPGDAPGGSAQSVVVPLLRL